MPQSCKRMHPRENPAREQSIVFRKYGMYCRRCSRLNRSLVMRNAGLAFARLTLWKMTTLLPLRSNSIQVETHAPDRTDPSADPRPSVLLEATSELVAEQLSVTLVELDRSKSEIGEVRATIKKYKLNLENPGKPSITKLFLWTRWMFQSKGMDWRKESFKTIILVSVRQTPISWLERKTLYLSMSPQTGKCSSPNAHQDSQNSNGGGQKILKWADWEKH